MSSVGSDDSARGTDANTNLNAEHPLDGTVRRTRKRFTSLQLMMLERLYHNASHPTREQREEVAKDAEM